jgi:hypothetical protein
MLDNAQLDIGACSSLADLAIRILKEHEASALDLRARP